MGRYVKAYTGTLALVCTGAIAVAVQAHDKAARLTALTARADRWETWARNEQRRDERSSARFSELAIEYRQLARRVGTSQRRLAREIAATRSLRRSVVAGSPVVTYRNVKRIIPVVTAPAATTATTTRSSAAGRPSAPRTTKPLLTPTSPKTPGAATVPAVPGSTAAAGAPSAGAPANPGTTPGSTAPATTPPAGTTPALTAPVNTGLPSILGQPQSGKTFSADPGSWTGNPTSFTYQWQRCDASGANCVAVGSAQSYTCVPADIDQTMRVAVQATNAAGSAVAVSAASPKTKPS